MIPRRESAKPSESISQAGGWWRRHPAQGRRAAAAHDRTEPAYVQVKAEIVVAVTAIPMRVHVSHTPHGSG